VVQVYFDHTNARDKANSNAQDDIHTELVIRLKTGYWGVRFNLSTPQKVSVEAWSAHRPGTLHRFMEILVRDILRNRCAGHAQARRGCTGQAHCCSHLRQSCGMRRAADPTAAEAGPVENLCRKRVSLSDQQEEDECQHSMAAIKDSGL
jgi:hypothetical protein